MANLTDPDRVEVWEQWMRSNTETIGINKNDLRAAVNAIDAFMNSNAAALNTAIPQPARGALSAAQKAGLLSFVINKRWIKGA